MKLIIAFALLTSGSVALSQTHDHAAEAPASGPQKSESATKSGTGCPMMDDHDKPQKDGSAPKRGRGMSGKGRMGEMAGKDGMPMQEACPMMFHGASAGTRESGKTTPDKDTDHADHR